MGVESTDTQKHCTHRPPRRLGPQTWRVGGAWLLAGNLQIKSAPTGSPAGSLACGPVSTLVWQPVQRWGGCRGRSAQECENATVLMSGFASRISRGPKTEEKPSRSPFTYLTARVLALFFYWHLHFYSLRAKDSLAAECRPATPRTVARQAPLYLSGG